MKKTMFLLATLMSGAFGCGTPVPQNKIAIVVKTMGERSTDTTAATSEIYWARRLPWGQSMNPAVKTFTFPLGLQDYEFSEKPSYESPNSNPIEVDCVGGHLKFDVNIQLYIDRSSTNLAAKLLAFVNDHQLQGYNGEGNMLARWAAEKLMQFVREPLAQYALDKQPINLMRDKKEINEKLLTNMNRRFNKYAIYFSSAGITSAIHVPPDQKDRMNQVVHREYQNRTLELRETDYMPLLVAITNIDQRCLSEIQNLHNYASQQSIGIIAQAQSERRQMFSKLVGEKNYIDLEQMLTLVKNLEGSPTRIMVIPKTLSYLNMTREHTDINPEEKKGEKK